MRLRFFFASFARPSRPVPLGCQVVGTVGNQWSSVEQEADLAQAVGGWGTIGRQESDVSAAE